MQELKEPIAAGQARDRGLRVALESHLPPSVPVGKSTAIFCFGHCFHVSGRVARLELLVDGASHRPVATRMPRRDVFEWLHVNESLDPAGHSYRSGFWTTITLPARAEPGTVRLDAAVTLKGGAYEVVSLGSIEVVREEPGAAPVVHHGLIAVAMATFEPDPELFRIQIESLRAQTYTNWRCTISDDVSSADRFELIRSVLDDDPRFVLSRAPERLGPYRNFERALTLAAASGAGLIALSDQDDRWYPEKLAVLRAGLGDAQLVYSDQRVVSSDGRVLRTSLWEGRRREAENLASMLIANSVPGAAALFRREVAELAVPFPDAPGPPYHDHWLALVALSSGRLTYVNRPLYDYVRHSAAVTGVVAERRRARALPGSRGLRGAYFGGYVARQVLAKTLLSRCVGTLTARQSRALRWFVASERWPVPFAWLALRPLRRLIGRDETLGGETAIVKGLLWRWLLTLAVGRAELPGRKPFDASFPDPPGFEQPRLRRWLAGE